MADLGEFYEKISKIFDVTITYNGSTPNISSDAVTLYIKQDENGVNSIKKSGDVATSGASGIAKFHLSPDDMDQTPGRYWAFITWTTGSDVHLVLKEQITIQEGVGDTSAPPVE